MGNDGSLCGLGKFWKGVQWLLNDPSYLELVVEMAKTFKLEDRTIINGIDL